MIGELHTATGFVDKRLLVCPILAYKTQKPLTKFILFLSVLNTTDEDAFRLETPIRCISSFYGVVVTRSQG